MEFYVFFEMVDGAMRALFAMDNPINCVLAVAQLTNESAREFGCYISEPWIDNQS